MSEHVGKFTLQPCTKCGHLRPVVSWNWLRWRRESVRVSLREVARQLTFAPAYLCDVEHGRRAATAKIVKFYEAL